MGYLLHKQKEVYHGTSEIILRDIPMAHLIRINPGSASEHRAQNELAEALPASWIVTSNIDERNFAGLGLRKRVEIDSVLITPLGLFVIDFKNYHGTVVPSQNGPWVIGGHSVDNPFDQLRDNTFAFKRLLERRLKLATSPWIEGLAVFIGKDVELNWGASNVLADENRARAILLAEVEGSVNRFASLKPLAAEVARSVLAALDTTEIANGLFEDEAWLEGTRRRGVMNSSNPRLKKLMDRLAALESETHRLASTDIIGAHKPEFDRLKARLERVADAHCRRGVPCHDLYIDNFERCTPGDLQALSASLERPALVSRAFGRNVVVGQAIPDRGSANTSVTPNLAGTRWRKYSDKEIEAFISEEGSVEILTIVAELGKPFVDEYESLYDRVLDAFEIVEGLSRSKRVSEYQAVIKDRLRPVSDYEVSTGLYFRRLLNPLQRIEAYKRNLGNMVQIFRNVVVILELQE